MRPGDETGRHAGLRSLSRKGCGFKSRPGHFFPVYLLCVNMNLDQYLDKNRFPLSTIPGLAINEQFNKDANSYDFLVEQKEKGISLTEVQLGLWEEFEVKIPHLFRLSTDFWASKNS